MGSLRENLYVCGTGRSMYRAFIRTCVWLMRTVVGVHEWFIKAYVDVLKEHVWKAFWACVSMWKYV